MRETFTCPKCQQPISLVDAPDTSWVECPLCQEHFLLSEALASAVESAEGSIPPEVTVVQSSEDEDLGAFFAGLAEESSEDRATGNQESDDGNTENDEDLDSFFANLVTEESSASIETPEGVSKATEAEELEFTEEVPGDEMSEDEMPDDTMVEAEALGEVDGDTEVTNEERPEEDLPIEAEVVEVEAVEGLAFEEASEEVQADEEVSGAGALGGGASDAEPLEQLLFDEVAPEEGLDEEETPTDELSPGEDEDAGELEEAAFSEDLDEEEPADGEGTGEGLTEEEASEEEADDDLTLAEEPPVQIRCPCCLESFDLEDLLLAETNQAIGKEAASTILADGSVREPAASGDGMRLDFGAMAAADQDHSGFSLASVEESPSVSPGAFEFASAVGDNTDAAEKPVSARPKRRRRQQSVMKDILGAIFGGAAGLLITYYCLNLFFGPRFDWFDVYLPLVKHTAVHRPGWLGGPPEEEEFDSGIGDALQTEEPPKNAVNQPKSDEGQDQQDLPPADVPSEAPTAEAMPPEEQPAESSFVGVLDQPVVTSEDLGQALRKIDELREAGPLTSESYEEWCRVAEAATFLEIQDGNPQTHERLNTMRRLIRELSLADVSEIARRAKEQAESPDRTSSGILFAGTAGKTNVPKDKGYMTALVMAGTGKQMVIASDHKLPIKPEDRVWVVGYLVDNPKEATEGLGTEIPQIVWVRTVVKFHPK